MTKQARLGETPFVVVDLETTGLFPGRGDRVVEIALVGLDPSAQKTGRTFTTLVNPRRDIGPTRIHGIRASDVVDAPEFHEVAGDVAAMMQGHVLVAHNARFDLSFLRTEFGSVDVPMPDYPALCTLHLAFRAFEGAAGRRLHQCCEYAGIPLPEAHAALHDATATASLLVYLLSSVADPRESASLEALGCACTALPENWCQLRPRGLALPRRAMLALPSDRTFLARLVEALPEWGFAEPDDACYVELLDRCLEDRRVTSEEADALVSAAEEWGLSRDQVRALHERYLYDVVSTAAEDHVVTPAERHDLEHVRCLLGLEEATLTDMLDAVIATGGHVTMRSAFNTPGEVTMLPGDLAGTRVCFSGDMMGPDGTPIRREEAEALATAGGLLVQNSVTKKLGLLVLADLASESTKAKKARQYNISVMSAASFWRHLAASHRPG